MNHKDLMIMMKNLGKEVLKKESNKKLLIIQNFILQNMKQYLVNLRNSTNKSMVNKRLTMQKRRVKILN